MQVSYCTLGDCQEAFRQPWFQCTLCHIEASNPSSEYDRPQTFPQRIPQAGGDIPYYRQYVNKARQLGMPQKFLDRLETAERI